MCCLWKIVCCEREHETSYGLSYARKKNKKEFELAIKMLKKVKDLSAN